ncbi:MAG: peptidylprolyl isomerase [Deltaproteobacteria bacterium]|nr:peptidylprolyl isomerase [Deltaproteobacteria bacterium]
MEGQVLTREVLDKELNKAMAILKNQLPADLPEDRMDDYKQRVRNRIIEGFVSRTLLKGEIERKNVKVSDQELGIEIDKIRASLPPGVTMEDLMKENNVSKVKMDEDIRFALQIKKLATSEAKDKLRPTAEEIKNYYQANKEKFNSPESVRARHILIAKDSKDDTETKAGKKAKLESIRKQIIDGADFADLAGKYSDCPSKNNGGDLGTFTKGQMVKPFEDAAFSQKVDEVGPVIETDFGYHIIRVTEKNQASATALDEPLKNRISAVLEQQKIQDTLTNMLQRLREKAKIVSHEN